MRNKILNSFLLIIFLIWTIGAIYCGHRYFPKTVELPPEIIRPTVHELTELAEQIAEPEIRKAIEYYESLPPVIITVQGEDSTHYETKEIFPKGSIDISKTFEWNFVFPNDDRASDTLSFSTDNNLIVTAYNDSLGLSYIGYSDFTQNINNFLFSVNPKVYMRDTTDKYSLFLGAGGQISTGDRILDQNIYKDYTLTFLAKFGVLIHEDWFIGIESGFSNKSSSFGIGITKKFFRIKGN